MITTTSKLLLKGDENVLKAVLKEAERAAAMGGSFWTENKYVTSEGWFTYVHTTYPDKRCLFNEVSEGLNALKESRE